MKDDIKNLIEILDWSKFEGELKPKMLNIVEQLKRFTYAMRLTGKVKVAAEFAGMSNYRMFMSYWFGPDGYNKLREYIDSSNFKMEMLEEAYNNFLMKDEEEKKEKFIAITPIEEVDRFIVDKSLSYENVLKNLEVHTALALLYDSPDFKVGIYWVISYSYKQVKGYTNPFLIMARVTEDKELCYIQGGWPDTYLNEFMLRIVPVGYIAKVDDLKFIELKFTKELGGRPNYEYIREWGEC